MKIICLVGRKGGLGRTTTTLSLSGAFAQDGLRVLCVDMDGQASLSRCLFGNRHVEETHPANTVAGLFDPRYDPLPEEVIQPTRFKNISLLAAGDGLEPFGIPTTERLGEEQWVLKRFFAEVEKDFDLVLIDTGPNTTTLTSWSSLAASDYVLSPVLPDAFGTQSVISVQRLTESVQRRANPRLRILGYFINMFQKNAVNQAYEQTLRGLHGGQVLKTVVPLQVVYREAVAERTPVTILKPKVKAAKVVRELVDEVSERMMGPVSLELKGAA